ncbi:MULTISPECIES: FISUMP domain-containing protein [unclassified Polaribacter]|uniref:FISUMP domain-containing protein n=1 Tax=unclassified Polaribacter TaxID=196858 RepID=UPI0011BD9C1A|nr:MULTISPECIES: FISUMP domain-containing protein [unclassified Polaribacter]TXD49565.1 hypothetical protein ES043_17220 [Polaribacter sp. IC063]TXD56209.1 hypothetical protein ES044_17270 [Polaribacter sp. IC066]
MKKLVLSVALIAATFANFAQVGIGTSDPDVSAILELKSTTKGFLPPRLSISDIQAIETPAEGLMFYCTDCDVKGLFIFNGATFVGLLNGLGLNAAVDAVNNDASDVILAKIGAEAGGDSTISTAELNAILPVLTAINGDNISLYNLYMKNNENSFSEPAQQSEVQEAINSVNNVAVLAKIGTEADAGSSTITTVELNHILPAITGVIFNFEDQYQIYIGNNAELFESPATQTEVQTAINFVNSIFVDVKISASNSVTFMAHNLGGDNTLDANTPVQAIHGNYYQWGRKVKVADTYTEGAAISGWNTAIATNVAWLNASKTANDPCPNGFRVPTKPQWDAVIANNTATNIGAFNNTATNFGAAKQFGSGVNKLTLLAAGFRGYNNGSLTNRGVNGYYWSSSVGDSSAHFLTFDTTKAFMDDGNRTYGFSVRCVQE